MEGERASPRSKLLEQIYVRGSDTVIRISDNAVIVKTTREGGFTLPDDMEEYKTNLELLEDDVTEQVHDAITDEGANGHTDTSSDRLVTNDDLFTLSKNIRDDWRSLALCHLNLSATDVETIIFDNPTIEDQVYSVLRLWKTREGKHATVKKLTAKLNQVIENEKWEFLMHADLPSEEKTGQISACVNTEGNDTRVENSRRKSSFDSDDDILPEISLVNSGEGNDDEETPLEENEPIAQNEPAGEFEIRHKKRGEDSTLEDIDRLSAVYTGFLEDKKDQFTSIGSSVGDVLQRVLTLDHENKKLKNQMMKLKEAKELSDALLASSKQAERKDPPKPARRDESEKQNNRKIYTKEDVQKQRDNYVKVKGHLKEAIEANREWETFGRKQRDKHKKEMKEKDAIIKSLESKVQMAETSSSDQSKQMDSILNATEGQVTEMQTELDNLRAERSQLKERLRRLIGEKRQVEQLSKDLLKQNTSTGSKKEKTREMRRPDRFVDQTATVGVSESDVPTDSIQEVLEMVKTSAKAPPNDDYPRDIPQKYRYERSVKKSSKTVTPPPENNAADDILFLKEQVLQYRNDFEKERQDREKAAGELESLRRELDDTKMMLDLQRQEYKGGKTGGTDKYEGARPEHYKSKKQGFPYMDPDQVASHRNHSDARNGFSWADDRDEVDCVSSSWMDAY